MLANREAPIKLSDIIVVPDYIRELESTLDPISYALLVFKNHIRTNAIIFDYKLKNVDQAFFLLDLLKRLVIHIEDNLTDNFSDNIKSTLLVVGVLVSLIWELNEKKLFTFRFKIGLSSADISTNDDKNNILQYTDDEVTLVKRLHQEAKVDKLPKLDCYRGMLYDKFNDVYNGYRIYDDPAAFRIGLENMACEIYKVLLGAAVQNKKAPAEQWVYVFNKMTATFLGDIFPAKKLDDCLDASKCNPTLVLEALNPNALDVDFLNLVITELDEHLELLRESIICNTRSSNFTGIDYSSSHYKRTPRLFNTNNEQISPIADEINQSIRLIDALYTKVKQLNVDSKNESTSSAAFRPS